MKCGYTQEELGNLLGMKTSTYSQFERKGKVDSLMLKKLATIFDIDIKLLLYGENEMEELKGEVKKAVGEEYEFEKFFQEIETSQYPVVLKDGYEKRVIALLLRCSESKRNIMLQCLDSS